MKKHLRTTLMLIFTALIASGGCSYMDEYNYYTLDFPEYNDLCREMNVPLTPIDYAPGEDALYSAMEKERVNQPAADVPSATTPVPTRDYDAVPHAVSEVRTTPPSNGREYRDIAEPQPSAEDEAAMAEYDSEGGYQVASVDPAATGATEEVAVEETVVEESSTYYEEVESSEPEVQDTTVKVRDENGRPVVETTVTTRTTTIKRSAAPDYYEQKTAVIAPETATEVEEAVAEDVVVEEANSAIEPLPEPVEETASADASMGETDLSDAPVEQHHAEEPAAAAAPAEEPAERPAVPSGLDDL